VVTVATWLPDAGCDAVMAGFPKKHFALLIESVDASA
jgi:hypothetical protein